MSDLRSARASTCGSVVSVPEAVHGIVVLNRKGPHAIPRTVRVSCFGETQLFRDGYKIAQPGPAYAAIRVCPNCLGEIRECGAMSTSRDGDGEPPQPRTGRLCPCTACNAALPSRLPRAAASPVADGFLTIEECERALLQPQTTLATAAGTSNSSTPCSLGGVSRSSGRQEPATTQARSEALMMTALEWESSRTSSGVIRHTTTRVLQRAPTRTTVEETPPAVVCVQAQDLNLLYQRLLASGRSAPGPRSTAPMPDRDGRGGRGEKGDRYWLFDLPTGPVVHEVRSPAPRRASEESAGLLKLIPGGFLNEVAWQRWWREHEAADADCAALYGRGSYHRHPQSNVSSSYASPPVGEDKDHCFVLSDTEASDTASECGGFDELLLEESDPDGETVFDFGIKLNAVAADEPHADTESVLVDPDDEDTWMQWTDSEWDGNAHFPTRSLHSHPAGAQQYALKEEGLGVPSSTASTDFLKAAEFFAIHAKADLGCLKAMDVHGGEDPTPVPRQPQLQQRRLSDRNGAMRQARVSEQEAPADVAPTHELSWLSGTPSL